MPVGQIPINRLPQPFPKIGLGLQAKFFAGPADILLSPILEFELLQT